ncbi:hypothetical protein J1614_009463 [Plenodomus biglobosus]|nr:hypothetical protein J1614_009463 [Plenodomus biglobosus]
MLQVKREIVALAKEGEYYHPDTLNVADGYACEFYRDYSTGRCVRLGEWNGPTDDGFHGVFDKEGHATTALYKCWESPQTTQSLHMARDVSSSKDIAGQVISADSEIFELHVSKDNGNISIIGDKTTYFKPERFAVKSLHLQILVPTSRRRKSN